MTSICYFFFFVMLQWIYTVFEKIKATQNDEHQLDKRRIIIVRHANVSGAQLKLTQYWIAWLAFSWTFSLLFCLGVNVLVGIWSRDFVIHDLVSRVYTRWQKTYSTQLSDVVWCALWKGCDCRKDGERERERKSRWSREWNV